MTVDLDGNLSEFITDDALVAVVGMTIDKNKNRLLVCNSDAGISKRSSKTATRKLDHE